MQVKGTAVSTLPEFIKEKFGNAEYERWLNSLSGMAKDVFSSEILSSAWFPLREILSEPTQKMCDLFYDGSLDGASQSGCYSAEKGLRGIYRTFIRFGSPEFTCKCASVILPTYFKPSKITVQSLEKGKVVLRILEFPEISKVVEYRISGWMKCALEISGGKNVKVKLTASKTENSQFTEFVLTWN